MNLTPEPNDIVECCLYKTALHASELLAIDRPYYVATDNLWATMI